MKLKIKRWKRDEQVIKIKNNVTSWSQMERQAAKI